MLELSVLQINNYIKNLIDEDQLLFYVGVFGEVSNYKMSGANAYFEIKDEGAQISCIKFGATADEISNGDKILACGRVNYHAKYGKLTFIVSKIQPYGMGELYKKFLELKAKLEAEGIFDERHKKQIPKYAKCIGVVSSKTGAVIHDIINVTRKNNPYTKIVLYPAKVQGEGAENEIAKGISALDKIDYIDTIIVARGGGSFEDLSPFNTEVVARAVFECKKPIVSGVGHETDFTLCDFASDLRAPTPSVAAEVSVFNYYKEIENINILISSIKFKIDNVFKTNFKVCQNYINNITFNLSSILNKSEKQLISKISNIKNQIDVTYQKTLNKLELISLKLEKSNPLSILKAGYLRAYNKNKVIKSICDVNKDDIINLCVSDGTINAKVIKGEKR